MVLSYIIAFNNKIYLFYDLFSRGKEAAYIVYHIIDEISERSDLEEGKRYYVLHPIEDAKVKISV